MSDSQASVRFWFQVEPFDANAYSFQVHSSTDVHYVELSGDS